MTMDNEPLLESGGQESYLKAGTEQGALKSHPQWFQWALGALIVAYVPLLILHVFLYLPRSECDCEHADAKAFHAFPGQSSDEQSYPRRADGSTTSVGGELCSTV